VSHEFFIWASYLVTFGLLAVEVVLLAVRARKGK
jgi:heme exporter protein CcmD